MIVCRSPLCIMLVNKTNLPLVKAGYGPVKHRCPPFRQHIVASVFYVDSVTYVLPTDLVSEIK